jgi:hypothetical protein
MRRAVDGNDGGVYKRNKHSERCRTKVELEQGAEPADFLINLGTQVNKKKKRSRRSKEEISSQIKRQENAAGLRKRQTAR